MKTLETARTTDCCDPTGGRLRSPGLYPVFSFVLRRASKLPCFRSQWFGGAGTIPCFRGGHTGHTLFVAASAVLVLPSLPKPQTNHSQAATCSRSGPQFSVLSLCIIHREPSIFFSAVQILIDLSLKILHQNIKSHRRAE